MYLACHKSLVCLKDTNLHYLQLPRKITQLRYLEIYAGSEFLCTNVCSLINQYFTSFSWKKKSKLSQTTLNDWKLKGKLWLVSHLYDVPVKLFFCEIVRQQIFWNLSITTNCHYKYNVLKFLQIYRSNRIKMKKLTVP